MKVRPIIFQPEMVRALLTGRKTQTRRLRWGKRCEPCQGTGEKGPDYNRRTCAKCQGLGGFVTPLARVEVGDVLYVRENWQTELRWDAFNPSDLPKAAPFYFPTEPEVGCAGKLRPSIHLPRRASRLTLAVTEVRFEPVQNISDEDALAEGINLGSDGYYGWGEPGSDESNAAPEPAEAYELLWREINGDASWNEDPEVVVIGFEVHRQNVDEFLRAGACFRETT